MIKKKQILMFIFLLVTKLVHAQTIFVPADHNCPDEETFELSYEFGADYNPGLPTVIVVSDTQQFYVQKGRITKIQKRLFGDCFNVLGIIPRSNVEELRKKTIDKSGEVNWKEAYRLFSAFQLAGDIEWVRKEVLAGQDEIYLYGQSGGALLITEYLSIYPKAPIRKVFIGAAVNSVIESKLGIIHDNFQRDFLTEHPLVKKQLQQVLSEKHFHRELVAQLLQRQNFFVELNELDNARSVLIRKLYEKDTLYIDQLTSDYEINAIKGFMESDYGIPIRVRLFEFIVPILEIWDNREELLYPDLENSYNTAEPLIQLMNDPEFKFEPAFCVEEVQEFDGEVFLLSGRYDHVADYRSSIYLAAIFNHCTLFIADDDHMFKSLKAENDYAGLIQDFFLHDTNDSQWLEAYSQYRWIEK